MSFPFSKSARGLVYESGDQLNRKTFLIYIVMLAFSMSLIPYTIDPYLPAFPAIGTFYGVDSNTIQASLAGVTIGLAIGQIVSGPISDAIGRRPMLLLASVGFTLSALAVFFAPSIEIFTLLRFSMALFAACGDVVARAIVRDLYRGQPMLRMLSRIFLIQSLSPILGPIVGSQLVGVGPWQSIFLAFGFFGLVLSVIVLFFLRETLPVAQRRSQSAMGLLRGFRSVLRDRIYVGLLIVSALQISALFGYLNVVSYLYQDHYGLSAPEFGALFAVNSVALYLAVQFGGFIAKYFKAQWMLVIYMVLGTLAGIFLVVTSGGDIWLAEIGFILLIVSFGAPATAIPTIALLNHGTEAGTAASLMGSANFIATSIFALVYSQLSTTSTADVGWLALLLFGVSTAVMIFVVRPWNIPDLRRDLPAEAH